MKRSSSKVTWTRTATRSAGQDGPQVLMKKCTTFNVTPQQKEHSSFCLKHAELVECTENVPSLFSSVYQDAFFNLFFVGCVWGSYGTCCH